VKQDTMLKGAGRMLPALLVALTLTLPLTALAFDTTDLPHKEKGKDRDRDNDRDRAPSLGMREPPRLSAVPIDRVIEQVERRYQARVVRQEETNINGRRVYVLRLLSEDGRVRTVRVDAETGGML
jgi:uncharacterized membrane protein YkoI